MGMLFKAALVGLKIGKHEKREMNEINKDN